MTIPALVLAVAAAGAAGRGAAEPGGGVLVVESGAAPPPTVVDQAEDGVVCLSGRDATILGTTLRWEPEPHKRTLGYWTREDDAAEWTFAVNAPGEFRVEVLQGCGRGQGGSEMVVTLDPGGGEPAALRFVVEDTGGFQEFRPRAIGRVTIAAAGPHVLRVKPERIAKQAACDIRQIRLLPVDPAATRR